MSTEWIYTMDNEGLTPLNRALNSSHMALTELLLRLDAEDGLQNLHGASLLHKAAYLGLQEAVRSLLAEGANPNDTDAHGETPLHKAAREGHYEAAQALIEHGADINAANEFGMTPLHWVALNGRTALAYLMVAAGGDPNYCDGYLDGLSPMALARIMGYDDVLRALGNEPPDFI